MGNKKTIRTYMPYGSVLIVDDTEFSLSVAEGLMKPYGLKIDTAQSGHEAIAKIRDGNVYDVIFMDYMMPGITGVETTKIIRGDGYTSPIIALSSDAIAGQTNMFLSVGMDDFISKPITVKKLNSILNKWIRDKNPDEEAVTGSEAVKQDIKISDENAEIIEKLKKIEGLYVDEALKTMGGTSDTYLETVKLMARKLPKTIESMDKSISAGDIEEFAVFAHGLKSVLKSVGAISLGYDAAQLESSGKGNYINFCREFYPPFSKSLLELSAYLCTALSVQKTGDKKDGDKVLLMQALSEVKSFIEDFKRDDALEVLSSLLEFTYDNNTDELLENAVYALEEFNYEKADSLIMQLES